MTRVISLLDVLQPDTNLGTSQEFWKRGKKHQSRITPTPTGADLGAPRGVATKGNPSHSSSAASNSQGHHSSSLIHHRSTPAEKNSALPGSASAITLLLQERTGLTPLGSSLEACHPNHMTKTLQDF